MGFARRLVLEEIPVELPNCTVFFYSVCCLAVPAIPNVSSHFFCSFSFVDIHFTHLVGGKMNAAISRMTNAKTSSRKKSAISVQGTTLLCLNVCYLPIYLRICASRFEPFCGIEERTVLRSASWLWASDSA